jgi:SAM-dependent methyltransferase
MEYSTEDRLRLRQTFDEDAERYDRARPAYPPVLFDDLASLTGLGAGAEVLEIGCGTGQATRPLAERGYRVLALEQGAALAAVARYRLSRFAAVEVATVDFEDWEPVPHDLVLVANAFHWLDPATRALAVARALRPGGHLATIQLHHVAGGTAAFFAEMQASYERWDPTTPPGLRLQPAAEIPSDDAELRRAGFAPATYRRYEWDVHYTTAQYLDLLLTYSGHRALPPVARHGLLTDIASLIDTRYAGAVVKRYLAELRLARYS